MEQFTVTVPKTFTEGWGVCVSLIHYGENDEGINEDAIVDLEVGVTHISPDHVVVVGEVPCVPFETGPGPLGDSFWVPVANYRADLEEVSSDSHDARDRWFATESEAREHAAGVVEGWANPLPWQAFIATE